MYGLLVGISLFLFVLLLVMLTCREERLLLQIACSEFRAPSECRSIFKNYCFP